MTETGLCEYLENYARLSSVPIEWRTGQPTLSDKYDGIDAKVSLDMAIRELELEEKFVIVVKLICDFPECAYWLGTPDIDKIKERAIEKMLLFLNKGEKI